MKKLLFMCTLMYIIAILYSEGMFEDKSFTVNNGVEITQKEFDPCGLRDVYCEGEENKTITTEQEEELLPTETLVKEVFGDNWKLAYAIIMAESGGNQYAFNGNNRNGSTDSGLWQINSIHKLSDNCMYDVECSTEFSYRLSKGGSDFTPWVAYNNKAYLKFL